MYGNAEENKRFEWYPDGCPYDNSGELKPDGYMPEDSTLGEVLEAYTGEWFATCKSGHGRRWETVSEDISSATLNLATEAVWDTLNEMKARAGLGSQQEDIIDEMFDEVYDESPAGDYFWGYPFTDEELSLVYNDFISRSKGYIEKAKKDGSITTRDVYDFKWFCRYFGIRVN